MKMKRYSREAQTESIRIRRINEFTEDATKFRFKTRYRVSTKTYLLAIRIRGGRLDIAVLGNEYLICSNRITEAH
jgi:hypothetical protein